METLLRAPGTPAAPAEEQPLVLWNPLAAVLWSLLLSPAFGAWLHMRNWERLGQPQQAAQARDWCVAIVAVNLVNLGLVAFGAASGHAISIPPTVNLAFLAVWFILAALPQLRYVAELHGKGYQRRPWLPPVLVGLVAMAAVLVLAQALAAVGR